MWNRACRLLKQKDGQGLVELALTLPVLILLFLGLIELGMAMRAYLVVVNANREAARFAARGTFTDEQIVSQALVSFAGQLEPHLSGPEQNTVIIVTRIYIPPNDGGSGVPTAVQSTFYPTGTLDFTTRISIEQKKQELQTQNDAFNDNLIATHPDAVRVSHEAVFVEIAYYHHQVLHAPIVEWVFPEPWILYSDTMMRVGSSRTD